MVKISIIIPVYNCEKYLSFCLDSILNQTFKDYEVIIINDGSSDSSLFISESYISKFTSCKIISQPNSGQAIARNIGVKNAIGDYILFVDADDFISKNMLSSLNSIVNETNADLVYCDSVSISEHKFLDLGHKGTYKEISINENSLIEIRKKEHYLWCPWAKLIRKEVINKCPFPSGMIYEDNAIVFKWFIESKSVYYLESVLYYYFNNPEGTSNKKISAKNLDYIKALMSQHNFYYKNKYLKIDKIVIMDIIFAFLKLFKYAFLHLKLKFYRQIKKLYKATEKQLKKEKTLNFVNKIYLFKLFVYSIF